MDNKLVSIKKAAAALGINRCTLREWERKGKITPPARLPSGHRRYDLAQLLAECNRTKDNKPCA